MAALALALPRLALRRPVLPAAWASTKAAGSPSAAEAPMLHYVRQIRSTADATDKVLAITKRLGLRGINSVAIVPNTPSNNGLLRRIASVIYVQPIVLRANVDPNSVLAVHASRSSPGFINERGEVVLLARPAPSTPVSK
jgi:ribosomal protein L30/L7E